MSVAASPAEIFAFAAQRPIATYEDCPLNLAAYDDVDLAEGAVIETGTGWAYALEDTWRRGRPHRMLPSAMLETMPELGRWTAMEETFDFCYTAAGLRAACLAHRQSRRLLAEGWTVREGWPGPAEVARFVELMEVRFAAQLEERWRDEDRPPWARSTAWVARTRATLEAARPHEKVLALSLVAPEGAVCGAQIAWVERPDLVFTTFRLSDERGRAGARLLLAAVAERLAPEARINDGPASGNAGLLRFKRELQPAAFQFYVRNVSARAPDLEP